MSAWTRARTAIFVSLLFTAGCSLLVNFDSPQGSNPPSPLVADPHFETVFNHPAVDGTLDPAVEIRVGQLIDAAASGSTLRAAVGALSAPAIISKLVAAHQRGVDVRLVSEDCPTSNDAGICTSGPSSELTNLKSQLPDGGVVFCHKGCLADGLQLNQFWLFSQLSDGGQNVVAQTSQPLDPEQNGQHNHLIIRSNDAPLANEYQATFDRLATGESGTRSDAYVSIDGTVALRFSPRDATADQAALGASDSVVAAINQVTCLDGGVEPGKIRVASSAWDSNRPDVATALVTKKSQGCFVEVLLEGGADAEAATSSLAGPEILVKIFRPGGCRLTQPASDGGSCQMGGLHSDFLLAESAGGASKQVLLSSASLTTSAIHSSDDVFLQIADDQVYQAFVNDFELLQTAALQVLPGRYPSASLQEAATHNSLNEHHAKIATSSTGYTAIVWESSPSIGKSNTAVFLRLLKDGQWVYETTVSDANAGGTNTVWSHLHPDVGVDSAGNSVVVWARDEDGNGYYNIAVRSVDATGKLSALVVANAGETAGDQYNPSVAVRPDGSFIVAWEDDNAGVVKIRAAGYSKFGQAQFAPLDISVASATAGASSRKPDLAVAAGDLAFAVWEEDLDGDGKSNIGMAKISSAGTVTHLSSANSQIKDDQKTPAIALSAMGNFSVAWAQSAAGAWKIAMRGFSSTGQERFSERLVTSDILLADPGLGDQKGPDISMDSTGRFGVTWEERDATLPTRTVDVYTRGFNTDGSTAGAFPLTAMNTVFSNDQHEPAIAMTSTGAWFLVFTDDYNGNGWGDVLLRAGFTNN